jgi:hypothetical protein
VFSGTAAQVESAFQTEIHVYSVNGELHHANATAPRIPRALAEVVHGVASLHDFRSQPQHRSSRLGASAAPDLTSGSAHYLAPADFATIYDLNGLYTGSNDGTGQSIAIVGRTNINLSDVQTFRSGFGLPANNPTIVLNGTDPGIVSQAEQGEATLDVEWSGAVARKANIMLVVSASTTASDGVDLSAQYIVNKNLAPVMSTSFGLCEAAMFPSESQFWNALYQQAAAQGISAMVASGDSGAAGCDAPSSSTASYGTGVNGLCSSPSSTCVGGTEFQDTANPGLYWSAANTNGTDGSALSYIPEAAWNESGSGGLWATGGGASMIYLKPSWQTGPGVPADGKRDVPDVALTTAGHDGYAIVMNGGYWVVSGTSAASPSFAGLVALTAQHAGARLGNINPVLYALAGRQASGGAAVFHDITVGNNSVPGVLGFNAGPGYDEATGLGSVDGSVLVNHWGDGSAAAASFQLTATPSTVSVTPGATSTVALRVAATGGFNSAIALSASGLPAGVTASFSPTTIPAGGTSSTLTLSATAQAAAASASVTISGVGGGVTQTAPVALTVGKPCSYSVSPTTATPPASGGSFTLQVTAGSGCSWTATSNSAWLTVTTGGTGSGNGVTGYTVAPNSTSSSRSGSIAIGGASLAVTQAAAPPFVLSPAAASVPAAGGTGTVTVTAPSSTTAWTAVSNASWIAITSGASSTGSKSVGYSVAANTTPAPRSGTMTIAGVAFPVSQAGMTCSFAVTPASANPPATGGNFTAQVTAPSGCAWTAASNLAWILITAGTSGSGNGTVNYTVTANTAQATRSGALTIAGQPLTVTQAAALPVVASLNPPSANVPATGGSGSVAVTAGSASASWTAVANASWISITGGASGTGNKSVAYTVASNTSSSPRTGAILISGATFSINQAGATCSYTVSPTSVSATAAAATYPVQVTTAAGCAWTAVSNSSFISIGSGATPPAGNGNGTVNFTASGNTATQVRSGSLTIAGVTVNVTQAAASANATVYSLSPAAATVNASGGTGSIAVSASSSTASWTAVSNASWVNITSGASGVGNNAVAYTVTPNTTSASRVGTLTVAGQTFTVTQPGVSCTYALGNAVVTPQTSGFTMAFPVITGAGCGWTATSNAAWLTVLSGSPGNGNGTAVFNVTVNNTNAPRTATVVIGGVIVNITQSK